MSKDMKIEAHWVAADKKTAEAAGESEGHWETTVTHNASEEVIETLQKTASQIKEEKEREFDVGERARGFKPREVALGYESFRKVILALEGFGASLRQSGSFARGNLGSHYQDLAKSLDQIFSMLEERHTVLVMPEFIYAHDVEIWKKEASEHYAMWVKSHDFRKLLAKTIGEESIDYERLLLSVNLIKQQGTHAMRELSRLIEVISDLTGCEPDISQAIHAVVRMHENQKAKPGRKPGKKKYRPWEKKKELARLRAEKKTAKGAGK